MGTPNPAVLVSDNGGAFQSTTNGVNVGAGDPITVKLANSAGVSTWTLSCIGTDDQSVAPAIGVSGIGNSLRTFEVGNVGTAFIFQSIVTDNQSPPNQYTTTFKVSVLAANGSSVMCTNERFEGNATYGWIVLINSYLRGAVVGMYGQIYTVAADSTSFSLPSAGTPVQLTFAHVGAIDLNVVPTSTQISTSLPGPIPVIITAEVAFTEPGTSTDIIFSVYQSGLPLPDGIRPTKYVAGDLGTVKITCTAQASAGSTFSLYAYTSGASGTTTLAVSNATLIVQNAGANQGGAGPAGPVGPSGALAPAGAALVGSVNALATGNLGKPINTTAASVTAQLVDGTDTETKTFTIVAGTHDFILTTVGGSGKSNIFASANGGVASNAVTITGVTSTITITWIAAGNGGLGGWYC